MKEMKQIGTVARTRLSNAAHLNMNQEIHPKLTSLAVINERVSKLQISYNDAIIKEQACVNRITKSANTEQMVQMDAARDKTFRFMKNLVTSNLLCPTEEIRMAAKRLEAIFRAYRGLSNKSFIEETAGIDGLLNDLKNENAIEDLKLLHLDGFTKLLSDQNRDYKSLNVDRIMEYSERIKIETIEARKATDSALDEVVLLVNAIHVMEPIEQTIYLVDTINQIFKKYTNFISAKAGHRKKPDIPVV